MLYFRIPYSINPQIFSINMFAVFLLFLLAYWTPNARASAPITREIFVNPRGGSGIFQTIQDAIDKGVPPNNKGWVLIHVAPGVYKESVTIPRDKPYVYLKGRSGSVTTVAWRTTSGSLLEATLKVLADNFIAQRITFKNTLNLNGQILDAKPAVAVSIQGDKNYFYECGFIGFQDTLYDAIGRHFFRSCYIEGAVDFIFGNGTSVYQGCVIHSSGFGFITAQSRSSPNEQSGFVFKYCIVNGVGPTFLGRAYGPYSRVLFYKSKISGIVPRRGWDSWEYGGHENRITYAEIGCSGEGANTAGRARWVKRLSLNEQRSLISPSFVDKEGWIAYQPIIH